MKKLVALFFLLFSIQCFGQSENPLYDEVLAKKVGADDYGMKKYFLVILKTGENTTKDKKFIDSCFKGHMNNMEVMVAKNQLIVAGPFLEKRNNFRGLFIINSESEEAVNKLLLTDPAIANKLLFPEVYPWYGSAALSEYLPYSKKVNKKRF